MLNYKKYFWTLPLLITSLSVTADQVINDDLIVGSASDGTAPAFDCSAGATLPLATAGDPTSPLAPIFNVASVTATIPAGDPVIFITLDFGTITNIGGINFAEYTCSMPNGKTCIGIDCSNGETFNSDTLRLKENNLRIRFHDTSVTTGLGESWNLEVNSKRNGGLSYFDFQVKSSTKDTIRLVTAADGPVPAYDCSIPHPYGLVGGAFVQLPPSTGVVPIGQPFITPVVDIPSCSGTFPNQICNYTCEPETDFTTVSKLNLGVAGANSTAIGEKSEIVANTVSVGRAALLRRIANVAKAINDTDILTLERLNDYSAVEDQLGQAAALQQTIDSLNNQLDTLTTQVDIIDLDDDDDGFSDIDEGICGSSSTDATSKPTDTDGDFLCDAGVDTDDDNDNVLDVDDTFPLDANESVDTDGDTIGNNADSDDDGDNVLDVDDAFPLDVNESVDTDGDGVGNNADPDDDGDNVLDVFDAFPLDSNRRFDTDGDGLADNEDDDNDNDSILNDDDTYPFDPTRSSSEEASNSGGGSFSYILVLIIGLLVFIRRSYIRKTNE